jgi:sarcosine oxidase subunit gamma
MNLEKKLQIKALTNIFTIGVKGPNAAEKLLNLGISSPKVANYWCLHQEKIIVMRTGLTEFVIGFDEENEEIKPFIASLKNYVAGFYPVARHDACWQMTGEYANDLLAEIGMLDIPHETKENQLCLTQMAGVNVIVMQLNTPVGNAYRIWCDGSYQAYMQATLDQLGALNSI